MNRPLMNKTLSALEQQADRNSNNVAELELLKAELCHRNTLGAKRLLAHIENLRLQLKSASIKKHRESIKNLRLGQLSALSNLIKTHWDNPLELSRLAEDLGEYEDSGADHMLDQLRKRMSALAKISSASAESEMEGRVEGEGQKPMNDARRWTEDAVAKLRTKLLDLGKKNPLISFKHGGRSVSHVRVVDERPDLLFAMIEQGAMSFEPLPDDDKTPQDETTPSFRIAYERARLTDEVFLVATEKLGDDEEDARAWQAAERLLRAAVRHQLGLPILDYGKTIDIKALAAAHGFDPSYDLKASDDEDVADHHEDDQIRILLMRKELDKRLKSIWERYRSHARETGLHTLFLVFGFVQWYEDDSSDIAHHAPLLLLPVELERKVARGRYEYSLSGQDEGLQINVALAEKMRQHFGLELPGLQDEETPESYFIRTIAVLERGRRLSLRRFATLAVLPFPRMILWKDLDPEAWPEAAFAEHGLLSGLLGATAMEGSTSMGETLNIDEQPWADRAPPLIQPADASQHSALIEVADGHSIAIEGPPGTGKSQTITNIIGTALAAGKKVLFVAEKQAALSVVASRLRHAGFGPLLLELHGDTANRADVYQGLKERLAASLRTDAATLSGARQQLRQQRDLIRRYLTLINEKIGSLDRSAYWIAWREIQLRQSLDSSIVENVLRLWQPFDVCNIDRAILAERRSRLENFGGALAALDATRNEGDRTIWVRAKYLGPFDQRPQLEAAKAVGVAAANLQHCTSGIEALAPIGMPGPAASLDRAVAQLQKLESFGNIDEEVACSALRDPDRSRALLNGQDGWRQLCAKLVEDVTNAGGVDATAIDELASALEKILALPKTLAETEERLAKVRAAIELENETANDRHTVTKDLALCSDGDISITREAFLTIAELGGAPAAILAVFRTDLLDPLAEISVDQEAKSAAALREDRAELRMLVSDEAFDMTADELIRLANVLTESSALGRLFGGEYRGAKRKADHIVRDRSDREGEADVLRRLARNKQRASSFRDESVARTWFPPLLWRGIDSDWQSLVDAAQLLQKAYSRLAASRNENALQRWLALSTQDRARQSRVAKRVTPLFESACDAGLTACRPNALSVLLEAERDALATLRAALGRVGAKSEAPIVRHGKDLAQRLAALLSAQREFDHLRSSEAFNWVGGIDESLESLARALAHRDALWAVQGPLSISAALRESLCPVETIAEIINARSLYAEAVKTWGDAHDHLEQVTGLSVYNVDEGAALTGWTSITTTFKKLAADETGARLAADLLKYRKALNDVDLNGLGEAALENLVPADQLPDFYELLLLRALLNEYIGGSGADLGRLGSLTLNAARKTFVRIDEDLHKLEAQAIVAQRLTDIAPQGKGFGPMGTWTDMSLIQHEIELRRPRTAMRDVIHRAGAALQALKPVWMMSPTSAAQYIRPGTLDFDLLVVDEASQMRPEFAISAIMRGDQFVVVGDANQLPPTDFFSTATDDSDDGDGDGDGGITISTESILDLANQRFRHKRRLKWHYRSQHESLIQFSNREFYQRDLIVFPSPTDNELLGVKFKYVGGTYEASINQSEAEAVINEAFRLMRAYPQHSIGIAAMNAKQTELIRAEFDRLILEEADVRKYVDEYAGGIEEFFIKNLENVQGDERDIIIISTVYGPDKSGTVAQRFGPMNRETGWRRLNVLVTRAKLSTRLFTSLRPDDVKVTENSSRGVRALKAYLTYAAKGARFDEASCGDADSDFEVFVADAIRGAGYEVVHQVGVEGFRIDLGIRHPDYPMGFIAGIECDGASFHSGLTVRDRDRIRQTILENMGWKIYRIWSTDWFADPNREMVKLLVQLDEWRSDFAIEYARRPSPVAVVTRSAASKAKPPVPGETETLDERPDPLFIEEVPSDKPAVEASKQDVPRQPSGRAMRSLDDIDWFEISTGRLYEIWIKEPLTDLETKSRLAGEVEVLSRAIAPPRVYGAQIVVARSEYEGRVEATNIYFKMHDIHACVREVARQAREAMA